MKKYCALMLGLFFLNAYSATSIPIQALKTKKNVPILLVERHQLPILDIAVIFKAGSGYDGQYPGLANITAKVMGQETRAYKEEQLMQKIASTGSQFNSSTNRDHTVWTLRTLTDESMQHESLSVLKSILSEPAFSKTIFNRVKSQVLVAIKGDKDAPFYQAKIAYFKAQYGSHPYAHPVIGEREIIQSLKLADVRLFYRGHFTRNNAKIVMVGDITPKNAIKMGNWLMNRLPEGSNVLPIKKVSQQINQKVFVPMNTAQSTLFMGQLGFSPYSADYYARLVGNDVLGGAGLNSILNKEVREKRGLAYFASSSLVKLSAGGPLVMYSQTQRKQAEKTQDLMEKVYDTFLSNGITEDSLNQSKRSLIGKTAIASVSNAKIFRNLVSIAAYNYPLNYFDQFSKNVLAVSRPDVLSAFSALKGKGLVQVVVGKSDVKK